MCTRNKGRNRVWHLTITRNLLLGAAAAFLCCRDRAAEVAKHPVCNRRRLGPQSRGRYGCDGSRHRPSIVSRRQGFGSPTLHFQSEVQPQSCHHPDWTQLAIGGSDRSLQHLSRGPEVYPDVLKEAGYRSHDGKGWGPGDYQSTGYPHNPAGPNFRVQAELPDTGISAVDYARNFEDFLSESGKDQPFCFWLGGQEPHRRYEPGPLCAPAGNLRV